LLLKQEGNAMFSVDLSIREGGGHVIVVLGGLEFIDSSSVAALARGRKLARHAGGDLLLAAPQHQVLRVLTLTRLIDVFPSTPAWTRPPGPPGSRGRRPRQWTGVPLASP
jgi:anti-anti-sigma factor